MPSVVDTLTWALDPLTLSRAAHCNQDDLQWQTATPEILADGRITVEWTTSTGSRPCQQPSHVITFNNMRSTLREILAANIRNGQLHLNLSMYCKSLPHYLWFSVFLFFHWRIHSQSLGGHMVSAMFEPIIDSGAGAHRGFRDRFYDKLADSSCCDNAKKAFSFSEQSPLTPWLGEWVSV